MGDILYQYTDAGALQGVVQNKVIWATDYRYLNDSQELVYTWSAFLDRLKGLAKTPGKYSQAYKAQLEAISRLDAEDLLAFDDAMFVACFTERRDALSQWIGYGDNGNGFALGFDAEKITMLKIPQYNHGPDGRLLPQKAIVGATDQTVDLQWGAFLQEVGYGDSARVRIVDYFIKLIEERCGTDDMNDFEWKVGCCVMHQHELMYRLPLVKHPDFEHEKEHRITITEHHGGQSAAALKGLASTTKPWSDFAQVPLITADVKFRRGGSSVFVPYTEMAFKSEALVEVIVGPKAKHRLIAPTVRRMLDRHGFRHTTLTVSDSPFQ